MTHVCVYLCVWGRGVDADIDKSQLARVLHYEAHFAGDIIIRQGKPRRRHRRSGSTDKRSPQIREGHIMTGSADATNAGDPGYGFYLIVSGAVNVRIRETDPVTGCVGGGTAPVVCVCVHYWHMHFLY